MTTAPLIAALMFGALVAFYAAINIFLVLTATDRDVLDEVDEEAETLETLRTL